MQQAKEHVSPWEWPGKTLVGSIVGNALAAVTAGQPVPCPQIRVLLQRPARRYRRPGHPHSVVLKLDRQRWGGNRRRENGCVQQHRNRPIKVVGDGQVQFAIAVEIRAYGVRLIARAERGIVAEDARAIVGQYDQRIVSPAATRAGRPADQIHPAVAVEIPP
jgi:hypothetical protein